MPDFTLSAPGSQETTIEALDIAEAKGAARRFAARYGIIDGPVYIYEGTIVEPVTKVEVEDTRPIYMFIYCASEHGSLHRHCDDDTAARKHAHILADAHGETCHIFRYTGQDVGEGSRTRSVGQVEPRIPKS